MIVIVRTEEHGEIRYQISPGNINALDISSRLRGMEFEHLIREDEGGQPDLEVRRSEKKGGAILFAYRIIGDNAPHVVGIFSLMAEEGKLVRLSPAEPPKKRLPKPPKAMMNKPLAPPERKGSSFIMPKKRQRPPPPPGFKE